MHQVRQEGHGPAKQPPTTSPRGGYPSSLLTPSEFHSHFQSKIGKNKLYELLHEGRIKSIRLGERKILIPASELTAWPARELERTS